MNSNDRDRPLGVFTMFPPDPLPANLLSNNGGGLARNLDRMAERVRDEAFADFMACPEVQGILRGEVVEIDPATVDAAPTVYDPADGWVAVDVWVAWCPVLWPKRATGWRPATRIDVTRRTGR